VQPPGVVSGRCRQRRMRYPSYPTNISNSANSPTMELGFDLCRLDPYTAEQDGKELGDHRRKIALRYAAKASHTGSSKMRNGCSGD
jgi:hypothetical protein